MIERDHPFVRGLGARPVAVVTAHHAQVRPLDTAAQRGRVDQKVAVAAAQRVRLTAAQPGPREQHHDQPVPRRQATRHQRRDLLI